MPRPSKPWFWRARKCWAVTIDGHRHTEKSGLGPRDYLQAAQWFERLKDQGAARPAGGLTVADLCESYLEWDESRVAAGQRSAESHSIGRIKLTRACAATVKGRKVGTIPVGRFTAGHFAAMIQQWQGEGLSPNYVRELGSAVKAIFAWAARPVDDRRELLSADPVVHCRLPTSPRPDPRFAERTEAAAWLRWLRKNGVDRSYRFLQRCLIHTGARPSEWARAEAGDYDSHTGVLTREHWKAAETTGRVRRVFVPARLRRSLQRTIGGLPRDARIFTTPRGLAWTRSNLSTTTQRYRRAAIADGIDLADEGADRLTCYRWRHTAASELLMRGVDIATVAELLGTSVVMIQRTYGHILSSHLAKAAETLARHR